MFKQIDSLLNKITTYKLLAYGLSTLAVLGLAFSIFGFLPLEPFGMMLSFVVVVVTCYVTNTFLSKAWQVPTNSESWLITALILFLILPPSLKPSQLFYIFLAGFIAIASKFLIAFQRKHIFNPAAFGIAVLGIAGVFSASWWVGSNALWPFVLLFGLLVVRKIRRFYLFAAFALVSFAVIIYMANNQAQPLNEAVSLAITSSPLIFLGTIMLTEPATMPSRRNQQLLFGAIVGGLFTLHYSIGSIFIYPELALILGNIYAYAVSPKKRLLLKLNRVEKMSDNLYDFSFTPDRKLAFMPGQYLEWTLAHHSPDSRGNRRTFTIASSPTENDIRIGVKFYDPSSSYKKTLQKLAIGDTIFGGQLAGNFTLPKDPSKKLVFIAGGIGITPFRSMLKYGIDKNEYRDTILLYLVSNPTEIAYKDVLAEATKNGLRTVKICRNTNKEDFKNNFDQELIIKEVTDYKDRDYFISGPNAMVENTKHMLIKMGVKRTRIKSDYFSGY